MKKTLLLFVSFFTLISAKAQTFAHPDLKSEASFKEYFRRHLSELNSIEGIWQVSSGQYYYKDDTLYDVIKTKKAARVAIISKDGKFQSYIITGEPYDVEFTRTDEAGVYLYRNYFKEIKEYSKTSAVISKAGEMKYEYSIPQNLLRIRMGDAYEEGVRVTNEVQWEKVFPEEGRKK